MEITSCPKRMIAPEVWELMNLADLADAGALPVAGGTLDQTCAFVDGWMLKRADDDHWKAQAMKRK